MPESHRTAPTYAPEALAALSPEELVDRLVADDALAPRSLIEACAVREDAMVAVLSRRLEPDAAWLPGVPDGQWWLRLHAVMILGLVATEAAGLLLATLMRRMTLAGDDDLEDWTSGAWPLLLRNKPQSAIDAVGAVMSDDSIAPWTRAEAAAAVLERARGEPEVLERTLDRIASLASARGVDPMCAALLCSLLLRFPRARHRRLADRCAARQATDLSGVFDRKDVQRAYARGRDEPDWDTGEDPWRMYSPGAIARREDELDAPPEEAAADWDGYPAHDGDAPDAPYVRATAKVGRNEPCPCGSGRKYKKCCLAEQAA